MYSHTDSWRGSLSFASPEVPVFRVLSSQSQLCYGFQNACLTSSLPRLVPEKFIQPYTTIWTTRQLAVDLFSLYSFLVIQHTFSAPSFPHPDRLGLCFTERPTVQRAHFVIPEQLIQHTFGRCQLVQCLHFSCSGVWRLPFFASFVWL